MLVSLESTPQKQPTQTLDKLECSCRERFEAGVTKIVGCMMLEIVSCRFRKKQGAFGKEVTEDNFGSSLEVDFQIFVFVLDPTKYFDKYFQ